MNGPYPDILFHFTDAAGLRGILKEEGFRPSYAKEMIVGATARRTFAVPIVSFCDLRLSELPFHMQKYGEFGIGLSKEWAQVKGLNPVSYANQASEFTNALISGIDGFFAHVNCIDDWDKAMEASDAYMNILNIERYIKNYEGELIRGARRPRHYRFADEREWRYVLPLKTKNVLPFVAENMISRPGQKEFFNAQIAGLHLKYSATDVKYIIVPSERNIVSMRVFIARLDGTYSDSDKEHLLARILTAKQIRADM